MRGLESAIRAFDGRGPHTVLAERISRALELHDMNDIMHRLYAPPMPRAEIAGLAPLVFDAVVAGDTVARHLIERAAAALAECVCAVARRLGMHTGPSELALVGGMFMAGDTLFVPFCTALTAHLPQCSVLRAEQPPAVGACLLARAMV